MQVAKERAHHCEIYRRTPRIYFDQTLPLSAHAYTGISSGIAIRLGIQFGIPSDEFGYSESRE